MLNKSIIQGRLTADAELKQTPSGKSVCSFTVATERNYTANNERITDFIPCVAWGNTAEFISTYFRKGQRIIVEGAISSRNWMDKDGKRRVAIELLAETAYFDNDKNKETSLDNTEPHFVEIKADEELPF